MNPEIKHQNFKNPVAITEQSPAYLQAVNQNEELYLMLEMRYGPGFAQKMIDDLVDYLAGTAA